MRAQKRQVALKPEMEKFLEYLKAQREYGERALKKHRAMLLEICNFMEERNITYIDANVRNLFITTKELQGVKHVGIYRTLFNHFEHFQKGESIPIRERLDVYHYSSELTPIVNKYVNYCTEKGNKFRTIRTKKALLRDFFLTANYSSLADITINSLEKACAVVSTKEQWGAIREFLRFCCKESLLQTDFSTIIPKFTKPKTIPSVYSVEEVRALEHSINRTSVNGKRDYACILLASRLGIRSGDIAKLKFENLDFENNRISFIQEKTDTPITLPLIPEIKVAITEYIAVRPDSKYREIFLRTHAPYIPITPAAFQTSLRYCFSKANICTKGKKKGPHSLRASLATSLINDSASYETVRRILGHNDKNVIQHYAKLDIEKLRICALPANQPSGSFSSFLEGGKNENF